MGVVVVKNKGAGNGEPEKYKKFEKSGKIEKAALADGFKSSFARNFDVTRDTMLGMPIITAIGNCQIYIENFKSIMEYRCDLIKLLTKRGMVLVYGDCLEILYYDDEEISIKGRIKKIEF